MSSRQARRGTPTRDATLAFIRMRGRRGPLNWCTAYSGLPPRPSRTFVLQAEDGIRDVAVTGVQTCALPISVAARMARIESAARAAGLDASLGAPCGARDAPAVLPAPHPRAVRRLALRLGRGPVGQLVRAVPGAGPRLEGSPARRAVQGAAHRARRAARLARRAARRRGPAARAPAARRRDAPHPALEAAKKRLMPRFLLVLFVSAALPAAATECYSVDPASGSVSFELRQAGPPFPRAFPPLRRAPRFRPRKGAATRRGPRAPPPGNSPPPA